MADNVKVTESVTVDGEVQQVETNYSQEDCNASALFYLIKSIEADGGVTPEGQTALNAAKDWTNAINPERYNFDNVDPVVKNAPASTAEQPAPAEMPTRVPLSRPGQG